MRRKKKKSENSVTIPTGVVTVPEKMQVRYSVRAGTEHLIHPSIYRGERSGSKEESQEEGEQEEGR